MRIEYNKLIRDRIPEIIEKANKTYAVDVMEENEYQRALLEKLVEEAEEVQKSEPEKLAMELADLFEVIDAVMLAFCIEKNDVLSLQATRRQERGGFEKKLRLLWTEDKKD